MVLLRASVRDRFGPSGLERDAHSLPCHGPELDGLGLRQGQPGAHVGRSVDLVAQFARLDRDAATPTVPFAGLRRNARALGGGALLLAALARRDTGV